MMYHCINKLQIKCGKHFIILMIRQSLILYYFKVQKYANYVFRILISGSQKPFG